MRMDRRGGLHPGLLALLASAGLVAGLLSLLIWDPWRPPPIARAHPIMMYCAAGLRAPVEAIAREYERTYGVIVQLQYDGSGTLLSSIRTAKTGDLFLAADETYIAKAREYDLVAESMPVARLRPVIAVSKGNPKGIVHLDDLLRDDVRVALANPDQAAIGKSVRQLLEKTGQWRALASHAKVLKPTVNDLANDLKIGAVDATIVWDATVRQYPELEMVPDPSFDSAIETVTLSVLKSAADPSAALRFARYLAARDRGLLQFQRLGYQPVAGDEWTAAPDLHLYCGAMLRPAVEQTLKDFEKREGVRITTVYNGCGILTAQMRSGDRPDAYFSCDNSFMSTVADLYLSPTEVSTNDLVILVPKGNPKSIHELVDLTRPGLRLGLGHPEKSAMGLLTQRLLEQAGLLAAVSANKQLDSPTGDYLVNQIRVTTAGSLDAIIAYRSNAAFVRDHLDVVEINYPLARAVQPYAVGKDTRYPQLMRRLQDALTSAESRRRFQDIGFQWRYAEGETP